jgi:hypothetical protein
MKVEGCRLLVARSELLAALRPIGKMLRKDTKQEAVIDPAPGGAEISLGGISMLLEGEGEWSQRVRVPGRYLIGVARKPPPDDPIVLSVAGERFHVGAMALPCVASPALFEKVELPMEPTPAEVLALRHRHGAMVIEQSGFERELKAAQERRDKLIAQATKTLAPLGVKEGDVRWAVERAIRRISRPKTSPGQVALFEKPGKEGDRP